MLPTAMKLMLQKDEVFSNNMFLYIEKEKKRVVVNMNYKEEDEKFTIMFSEIFSINIHNLEICIMKRQQPVCQLYSLLWLYGCHEFSAYDYTVLCATRDCFTDLCCLLIESK